MHITALKVKNFRRLKDVLIDLDKEVSILVGSNNSGKTSTAHVLQAFISSGDRISIYDFNSTTWSAMNEFGESIADSILPTISLDIWFHVDRTDLHRIVDLLPSLDWQGSEVGVRIEFAPSDLQGVLPRFIEAREHAREHRKIDRITGTVIFHPQPKDMFEYLTKHLSEEYGLKYYVLDRARFSVNDYVQEANYIPGLITPERGRSGRDVISGLIKVNVLNAQRHLSDKTGGNRTEDLSRHLGRYYGSRLEKREDDYAAMAALSESESLLNQHLEKVFATLLKQLSELGYPERPKLIVRSALTPEALMGANDQGTRVHYVLNPGENEPITLPDRYNGLGFKNLIYMVVQLLDLQEEWLAVEEDRPPLHLLFIEEPEVHLHAQLQQVFIRKIMGIVAIPEDDKASCHNQFIVTTHSPHILYERGFIPIRYFRRSPSDQAHQTCEVLNLSLFYGSADLVDRDFLQRYMKLTHCDLFFSDAAILVEGNVERLLMAQMIEKSAKRLQSVYLSVLEVGGAFAHRFRTLIEFLGITALIITDIDSVVPRPATISVSGTQTGAQAPTDITAEEPDNDDVGAVGGAACPVSTPDAVTSNQCLLNWVPRKTSITELLLATPEERTQVLGTSHASVRVAYQCPIAVEWRSVTNQITGRTLEEAFALQNLEWTQNPAQADLNLSIRGHATKTLEELALDIYKRVKRASFKKTDFALALLTRPPSGWNVPRYIVDGLQWLENQVTPEVPAKTGSESSQTEPDLIEVEPAIVATVQVEVD